MGRGSTATFGGGVMPKINSVDAWDGKDGQVSRDFTLNDCADAASDTQIMNSTKRSLDNIC